MIWRRTIEWTAWVQFLALRAVVLTAPTVPVVDERGRVVR